MKKKGYLISIIVISLILTSFILGIWTMMIRNNIVMQDELIQNKWSKVESAYQRRLDLIPNLVNTVKGYAKFEQETLNQVINARSKATQATINPSNLTPETVSKFQKYQDKVSSALSRLLVTVERYPDLKANQGFLELQSELSGTENRIKIERDQFNDAIMDYNNLVRIFPNYIIANFFGFSKKAHFKSEQGSQKSPKVLF